MDTIQCAVVLAKLPRFSDELRARAEAAHNYDRLIEGKGITKPRFESNSISSWAQYTIQVPDRDSVKLKLASEGIPSAIYYSSPINKQPAYRHFDIPGTTPVADSVANSALSLPISADITYHEQKQVVAALLHALD